MKRSVKILWRLFWLGCLAFVGMIAAANFGLFGKMPSIKELQNPEADLASELYTSDGKLMGKFYAENRSEIKHSEISPNIINALIATEDVRFKDHSGIDGEALARAVGKFGKDGGGSTITQQLAKMMLRQGNSNILARVFEKLKEYQRRNHNPVPQPGCLGQSLWHTKCQQGLFSERAQRPRDRRGSGAGGDAQRFQL
jgi:penicillin-binding protein 1A